MTADRVRLGCYGVNGGRAGKPFCVTVDLYGRAKDLGGLVDGEPLAAGQVLRVVTTGGGWGEWIGILNALFSQTGRYHCDIPGITAVSLRS